MFGRIVDWTILLGSIIGLVLTGWWTVYAAPSSVENLQNILQLQAEKLLDEGGHSWAKVSMDGQHAHLSGQSPNVEAVDELLATLGEANPLTGPITKITSNIASAPPISPYIFEAIEDGNRLKLRGHVPSRAIKIEIMEAAEALYQDRVDDELRIGTGQPLQSWKETALAGLNALNSLIDGQLTLIDSDVYLSGESETGRADTIGLSAFVEPRGPYRLITDISGPALWEAKLDSGLLLLKGNVESEVQKASFLEIVETNFDGPVHDEMRVLDEIDAADWTETAKSILPGFLKFQSGRLRFSPHKNEFSVEGLASGSVQTYLRQDVIERAYPVRFDIETVEADLTGLEGLDFENNPKTACQQGFNAIMAEETIQFKISSATISRESGLTLDKIVTVASKCNSLLIEVRGHTDSAGSREANIVLSKDRAAAVLAYMVDRGIPADRLDAIGFGPDLPIADNATASGRAANRRIEFNISEEG